MSTWDKLISRVLSLSSDIRFDELKRVLESCGYTMKAPKGGGSHCTFRKDGCIPITVPRHGPVKKIYIEKVREIVESEATNDD